MENIKILGIDPAPGKNSTIFDGEKFIELNSIELGTYLEKFKAENIHIVICWDSPLTGIPDSSLYANNAERELTYRKIEIFFTSKEGYPLTEGINIRGYGGCPHWTISKHLLGLPIMGKYDRTDVPFNLVFDSKIVFEKKGHYITETHPAVALYLLLKDKVEPKLFLYKGAKGIKGNINKIYQIFCKELHINDELFNVTTDDQLDAFICYHLADEWINKKNPTMGHIGNYKSGSFLVPNFKDVKSKFESIYGTE